MKGRKHTAEQVIRKLREGERLAAEGKNVAEVARELEISEQTYSRWRNQYGGMKADDAKELRRLRDENGRLKRVVADLTLDNQMLKEVDRGNFCARRAAETQSSASARCSASRSGGLAGSPDSSAPLSVMPGGYSRPRRHFARACERLRRHGRGTASGAPGRCCATRGGWSTASACNGSGARRRSEEHTSELQ